MASFVSNQTETTCSGLNSQSSTFDSNMGCCFSTVDSLMVTPSTVPAPSRPPSFDISDRTGMIPDVMQDSQLILPASLSDHGSTSSAQ